MNALTRYFAKWVVLAVLVFVAAALFVYSGSYNVAATNGHSAPFEWIFRSMTVRSVIAHARDITPPADFNSHNPELAEHAAGHYEMMCRTCHGAPGKKADPWQLYPPAPDLIEALRVTRWTNSEVFWIIKNGIKDTGMSAFGGSHSDEDIWALTAFIRQLPTTTPEQYRAATQHSEQKENKGGGEPPEQSHNSAPASPDKHS